MSTPLTELWAWCADCERWFYCGGGREQEPVATPCPVCLGLPERIENRPPEQVAPPRREPAQTAAAEVLVRLAPRLLNDVVCIALRRHGLTLAACPVEERRMAPRAPRRFPVAVVSDALPADASASTVIRVDDMGSPRAGCSGAGSRPDRQEQGLERLLEALEHALSGRSRP